MLNYDIIMELIKSYDKYNKLKNLHGGEINFQDTCNNNLDSGGDYVSSIDKIKKMIDDRELSDYKYIYNDDNCIGIITGKWSYSNDINNKIITYYNDNKINNYMLLDKDKNVFQIKHFLIDIKYQGLGYGTIAINKFISYITDKYNINEIHIATNNKRAVTLYKKINFKPLYDILVDDKNIYYHLVKII